MSHGGTALEDILATCRERLNPTDADRRYMRRALELARLGTGLTSPNPMVGAVIVKNGAIVGEGYHGEHGGPHAEVVALRSLDDADRARGATLYVTLEPCCHQGKTGPCSQAVLEAGISRVVIATRDPSPHAGGRSLGQFVEAGIPVELGLLEREAVRLNAGFLMVQSHLRPFVTAKWAMTMDGRMAATSGDSQWISNKTSLQVVHRLRSECDAIMVGIGTVLRDNPRLNVRLPGYHGRQPRRVVIDSRLRTPRQARVVTQECGPAGKAILVCSELANETMRNRMIEAGADILPVGDRHGMIDMNQVLQELAERGIQNLLVEGGSQLHGSMLRQRLIDKIVAFIAPKIIGGKEARNPIEGFGLEYMRDALNLTGLELRAYGTDLCMTGYVKKPDALPGLYDAIDDAHLSFERPRFV